MVTLFFSCMCGFYWMFLKRSSVTLSNCNQNATCCACWSWTVTISLSFAAHLNRLTMYLHPIGFLTWHVVLASITIISFCYWATAEPAINPELCCLLLTVYCQWINLLFRHFQDDAFHMSWVLPVTKFTVKNGSRVTAACVRHINVIYLPYGHL